MSQKTYRAHLPAPSIDSAPFWEGCTQGKLLLQQCVECERMIYFPRRICPHCGASALRWSEACGRGRVFSFSEVHVSFYGPEWSDELPYTLALIDLDEGPRMLSRLIGDTAGLAIGDPVQVVFVDIEDQKLPYFQRSASSQ